MKSSLLSFFLFLAAALCHPVRTCAQINWQHTQGPEGGIPLYTYFDDQYAFVSDEYYLYRTADGQTWEQLPYGNLWPIGTSPTKIAAVRGYGFGYDFPHMALVVSYDEGDTWVEGSLPPTNYFSSLAVCSHGIYVPSGTNGSPFIYRTQDDGQTPSTRPLLLRRVGF